MRHAMRAEHSQSGLSLIEMMVGLTIGMIVVAGAAALSVGQLNEHRRLVLETQIQQDLRAAADLILRDVRRAGYWDNASNTIWPAAERNPYGGSLPVTSTTGNTISYDYSVYSPQNPEDNRFTPSNEQFGFRLSPDQELQFQLGQGNWQPLTDRNVMRVTEFRTELLVQPVVLKDFCASACDIPGAPACPRQLVRTLSVSLQGLATHDAKVVRHVTLRSRLRNDAIVGACPS